MNVNEINRNYLLEEQITTLLISLGANEPKKIHFNGNHIYKTVCHHGEPNVPPQRELL